MLPNSNYLPTRPVKSRGLHTISALIIRDLLKPPLGVGLWRREVLGAPVPIAAVNEDRDTLGAEDDIGLATEPRDGTRVLSESKPEPVQRAP